MTHMNNENPEWLRRRRLQRGAPHGCVGYRRHPRRLHSQERSQAQLELAPTIAAAEVGAAASLQQHELAALARLCRPLSEAGTLERLFQRVAQKAFLALRRNATQMRGFSRQRWWIDWRPFLDATRSRSTASAGVHPPRGNSRGHHRGPASHPVPMHADELRRSIRRFKRCPVRLGCPVARGAWEGGIPRAFPRRPRCSASSCVLYLQSHTVRSPTDPPGSSGGAAPFVLGGRHPMARRPRVRARGERRPLPNTERVDGLGRVATGSASCNPTCRRSASSTRRARWMLARIARLERSQVRSGHAPGRTEGIDASSGPPAPPEALSDARPQGDVGNVLGLVCSARGIAGACLAEW